MRNEHLILLHDSNWSSNIGNAFFTLGVKYVLEQVAKRSRITQTSQLSSLANHRRKGLIEKNDIKYPAFSSPNWFVISGPIFDSYFLNRYSPVLENVMNENSETKLIILNAGSIKYETEEIDTAKRFLEKYPPEILITRDEFTYKNYSQFANYSYSGFDMAFFSSDYYIPYETERLGDYITLCFDNTTEPKIHLNEFSKEDFDTWKTVKFGSNLKHPHKILKHFDFLRNYEASIGNFNIVRPNHGALREYDHVLFGKKNSFVSLTPYGYLNLYANTSLTVSDRVHACIPTLAFGNPARLISTTKRKKLFERLGMENISDEIIRADLNVLKQEKSDLMSFLTNCYNRIVM